MAIGREIQTSRPPRNLERKAPRLAKLASEPRNEVKNIGGELLSSGGDDNFESGATTSARSRRNRIISPRYAAVVDRYASWKAITANIEDK